MTSRRMSSQYKLPRLQEERQKIKLGSVAITLPDYPHYSPERSSPTKPFVSSRINTKHNKIHRNKKPSRSSKRILVEDISLSEEILIDLQDEMVFRLLEAKPITPHTNLLFHCLV